mmetsp:Transcript_105332/g.293968  ORF Transcript_105332/g.293968 Transcript_105332/m.293968 type:complete len:316 (-) Transcript_105332:29-976(-)
MQDNEARRGSIRLTALPPCHEEPSGPRRPPTAPSLGLSWNLSDRDSVIRGGSLHGDADLLEAALLEAWSPALRDSFPSPSSLIRRRAPGLMSPQLLRLARPSSPSSGPPFSPKVAKPPSQGDVHQDACGPTGSEPVACSIRFSGSEFWSGRSLRRLLPVSCPSWKGRQLLGAPTSKRIFARPKSVTLARGTSSRASRGAHSSTFRDFRSRCTTGGVSPCRYAMPWAVSCAILCCCFEVTSTSEMCSRLKRLPPRHISSTTSKVLAPWQKPSSRTRFGCRVRDITPSSRTKKGVIFSSVGSRFTATSWPRQVPMKT